MAVSRTVSALQNQRNPTDVNTDGITSPIDALMILNELNKQAAEGESAANQGPTGFFDVTGDFLVTPLDALNVLNAIVDENTPLPVRDATDDTELLADVDLPETLTSDEKRGSTVDIPPDAADAYLQEEYESYEQDEDHENSTGSVDDYLL